MNGIPTLHTPEEVSKQLGGHVSAFTIRRLASQKKIASKRMARNKIVLDDNDVQGLLDYYSSSAEAPVDPPEEDPFEASSRSKAIQRNRVAS